MLQFSVFHLFFLLKTYEVGHLTPAQRVQGLERSSDLVSLAKLVSGRAQWEDSLLSPVFTCCALLFSVVLLVSDTVYDSARLLQQ